MVINIPPSSRVKCVNTEKLFFGRFAFSISAPFAAKTLTAIQGYREQGDYRKYVNAKINMQSRLLDRVYDLDECPEDMEYRVYGGQITFYTNDGAAVEQMVANYPRMFNKVSRPLINPELLADQDINVIVREKYFFEKYAIKITMNWVHETQALDEIVEENFDNPDKSYYNYGVQRVLYVDDMATLIRAKLTLNNFIQRVEKIKLVGELTA